MRLAILLALVGAALVPASASAAPVPAPPHVTYVQGKPPGWVGPFRAAAAGDVIYLSRGVDRWTREHELGHVFDYLVLTDADRAYFTRLMRLAGPWTDGERDCDAERCPDEWFADWYANARIGCGPTLGNCWETGYAESPRSDRQFVRFLARVRRAHA